MALSVRDRVSCEDVVMFVNASITSTGQREFHSTGYEQRLSLSFLHSYVLINYRELYAATLALGCNDHNAALITVNLLSTGRDADLRQRAVEGRLVGERLRTMALQRVYKVFDQLRRLGVNNRRVRAIMRDWLAARPDLAFDAVKYRRALAGAARHAHLDLPAEVGTFLFDWRRPKRYEAPILDAWRRAHYEKAAMYELPYTVAEGFASRHKLSRQRFLTDIAPRLTRNEQLRLQGAARRAKVDTVRADLARTPLTRLASYVLGLPRSERSRRRVELTAALRHSATRAAGSAAGTWGRVVAILDDSYSASGSGVKRRRPLAVALATHYLLEALAGQATTLWLSHRGDPLLVHPIGPTGLGARLLDGLELRPDRLIIVSDGWDNAPVGLAAEVLRVWRTRLDPAGTTEVVHLNPVYDSDTFDVRRLAPGVATVGVRDAEDIVALVELARFSHGTIPFAEFRQQLIDRVTA